MRYMIVGLAVTLAVFAPRAAHASMTSQTICDSSGRCVYCTTYCNGNICNTYCN